jgi:hypothetical protein
MKKIVVGSNWTHTTYYVEVVNEGGQSWEQYTSDRSKATRFNKKAARNLIRKMRVFPAGTINFFTQLVK